MIKYHKQYLGLLYVLLLTFSSYAQNDKPITLKMNLTKGQKFKQNFVTEQKIKQNIFGNENDMTQTIAMKYSFEVTEKEQNGNMTWLIHYESIKFAQESALTGKILYDSESKTNEGDNPLLIGFKALVGQKYSVRITPEGKVLEVIGWEEMLNSMVSKMDLKSAAQAEQMKAQLKGQYGADALKTSLESSFAFYPEKPIKIGDTWNNTIKQGGMQAMILENTYKLVDINKGIAQVEITSNVKPNSQTDGNNAQKTTLEGKQGGTSYIEIATGWLQTSDIKQNLKGKVHIQGMDIDMDILSEIKLSEIK